MSDNKPRSEESVVEEEARNWIARMASAEMTAAELATFKTWRAADSAHDRAFAVQRAIWRAAGDRPLPDNRPARTKAGRRLYAWRLRRLGRLPRPIAASGMTAALVAGLLFGPDLMLMAQADHQAGIAVENVDLPDGSRAMLNAGSAIAISYSDNERRIELLRGNAWFDVAHGDTRPFRVAALGGVTEDIGTAFEVRREGQQIMVGVTEGAVKVSGPESKARLLLRASNRAHYGKDIGLARLGSVKPSSIAAWRNGEILFERTSPADAIDAIRPYRSGPVYILGKVASKPSISGAFRTDRPDEAIDAIARMAGLSIYRLGDIILLRPAS